MTPSTSTNARPRAPRSIVVALVALLAGTVAVAPDTAQADVAGASGMLRHLRLVRSFPAADTVLAASPDSLRLWLSEPAELPSTKVTLADAKGTTVRLGAVKRGTTKDAPVVAAVPAALAPGRYTVTWRTMSKDGHVVKGAFAFRVGATR